MSPNPNATPKPTMRADILEMMESQAIKYRVLSLDGGGSWALLQAMILGDLFGENTPGLQILKKFNVVVANSGGSIVAALLALDWTPKGIVDKFFKEDTKREAAFSPTKSRWQNKLAGILGFASKYDTDKKLAVFEQFLKLNSAEFPATLDEISSALGHTNLIIVAFDYDTKEERLFKTNASSASSATASVSNLVNANPSASDKGFSLAQAVAASSTAPVLFFDKPTDIHRPKAIKYRYWDGAVAGFNNPVLIGVTEAMNQIIHNNNKKIAYIEDYDENKKIKNLGELGVLSIGNGRELLPIKERAGYQGARYLFKSTSDGGWLFGKLKKDIKTMATSILSVPTTWANYTAYKICEQGQLANPASLDTEKRIFRVNPMIMADVVDAKTLYPPTGLTECQFKQLVALEMDAVEKHQVELIEELGTAFLAGKVRNQPIQMDTEKLIKNIGYDTYI